MFESIAPARVCLYGEHQDYLELKVIPAAINLLLKFQAKITNNDRINVHSTKINERVEISLKKRNYSNLKPSFRGYLIAGLEAIKDSYSSSRIPSLMAQLESQIPIDSGLSSSAALLVAWINLLTKIMNINLLPQDIAELAYKAEHDILRIPCGKMDQYSSALGSIISLKCTKKPEFQRLNCAEFDLIVINSQSPKLTSQVHGNLVVKVKQSISNVEKKAKNRINNLTLQDLQKKQKQIKKKDYNIVKAVISIKEDTKKAEQELLKKNPDIQLLGELLNSQQKALREGIKVSLPILDKIIQTGKEFGAIGGKLTGAGLGGSVVLMSQKSKGAFIAEKIKEKLKLPTWKVQITNGVRFKEIKDE